MALTRNQKLGLAYTDWVAGVCSVAFAGPFSFAIGGAASAAVYFNNGWKVQIAPDPIQGSSTDQGVLHNALVSNYIAQGFLTVNYTNVIDVACQLRPDLTQQLRAIPEQAFDGVVRYATALDLSTVKQRMDALTNQIPTFTAQDLAVVTCVFNGLQYVTEPVMWAASINSLISLVPQFTLAQNEMDVFTSSLQILRSSYILWSQEDCKEECK